MAWMSPEIVSSPTENQADARPPQPEARREWYTFGVSMRTPACLRSRSARSPFRESHPFLEIITTSKMFTSFYPDAILNYNISREFSFSDSLPVSVFHDKVEA